MGAQKEYEAAADLFQLALTLPGSGAARVSGSVTEFAVPSQGEANSALYNLACCFAATGRAAEALDVLRAALDNGFDDVAALRADGDLAPLRAGGALDKLLSDWASPLARLSRSVGKKEAVGGDGRKRWITW